MTSMLGFKLINISKRDIDDLPCLKLKHFYKQCIGDYCTKKHEFHQQCMPDGH